MSKVIGGTEIAIIDSAYRSCAKEIQCDMGQLINCILAIVFIP